MVCSRVGIVGCGSISEIYAKNLSRFAGTSPVSCYDIESSKAELLAERHDLNLKHNLEELCADPCIDTVLILSHPQSHHQITIAALKAGKHVYCEKPAGLNLKEVQESVDLAASMKLLYGVAPDTWMGPGFAHSREVVESGGAGSLRWVQAAMLCGGHEKWHPNPEFFYKKGGGPLWDMGPYYLSWLVLLCGPIEEVQCFAKNEPGEREYLCDGELRTIKSEVYTHYQVSLKTRLAPIQMVCSFDVPHSSLPPLNFCFERASVAIPDPNGFHGSVKLIKGEESVILRGNEQAGEDLRGIGIACLHKTLLEDGSTFSGRLALHVTEVMEKIDLSAQTGERQLVESDFPFGEDHLESILSQIEAERVG